MVTSLSLGEISHALGGEVVGSPHTRVEKVGTLENADERCIAFLTQDRFVRDLQKTRAGAVILGAAHRDATALPRIVCRNPHAYFARVSAILHPVTSVAPGVHPSATVDPSATLGNDISVGAHAVIGRQASIGAGAIIGAHCFVGEGTAIGAGARLWPGVVIYHDCHIGARCILHAGVVIGADGFGNAWEQGADGGRWIKVPQVGRALIGDDVEIGANTTIDRGAIDDTVIEAGVRLDNLIMIAHNVHVGAHTAIAACTGIAGSTRIGRYCRIGG
ncbi:MAG TPA: UDP-3-O-(3-hydroxymyristoyl)glucosamine N-acyltransferase, partial [Burkholderiales bacterium]|nr:UDP-3-O-(3-hydroxymyristoyl)glucosamine N-acyltransferase [Burkholderiales bacterium]